MFKMSQYYITDNGIWVHESGLLFIVSGEGPSYTVCYSITILYSINNVKCRISAPSLWFPFNNTGKTPFSNAVQWKINLLNIILFIKYLFLLERSHSIQYWIVFDRKLSSFTCAYILWITLGSKHINIIHWSFFLQLPLSPHGVPVFTYSTTHEKPC